MLIVDIYKYLIDPIKPIFYKLRSLTLVSKIAKYKGTVNGDVRFWIKGDFTIPKNLVLHGDGIDNSSCLKIVVAANAILEIGENVGITQSVIHCYERIVIGNNVKIGAGCMIMDTNFHSTNWKYRICEDKDIIDVRTSPVYIGANAFVGARTIICKGVKIGENSIVAAGSVVVKDIPSNCIAGGNPCAIIRYIDN